MEARDSPPFSRQLVHVMRCALTQWIEHRAASKGAALAFYTLFSIAPVRSPVFSTAPVRPDPGAGVPADGVAGGELAVLENYLNGLWKEATLLLSWLASAVSFCVIAVLFGVIYKMLPRIRLSWKDVVIGALGTAAMFTLGKFAIGLYIGNSGVANSFGAAGSMIALLLWVYYSAQIFFLGAEFARQYALQLGSLRDKPPAQTGAAKLTSIR